MFPPRAWGLALAALVLLGALGALAHPAEASAAPTAKVVPQHLVTPEPGTEPRQPRIVSSGSAASPTPASALGAIRFPVIPVEFAGLDHSASTGQLSSAFNGASSSVFSYYNEASGGRATMTGDVTNWVRSARTMAYYGQDSAGGIDDATGPIYRLVTESVQLANAADPSLNFASYDRDGDGVVDHVVIVHAGAPQESSANTNDIWSHHWVVVDANPATPFNEPLMVDGVQVYSYIMVSESSPIGVVCHEFGHQFGLPDLYDTDSSSSGGVGEWDIMATGSWNGVPSGSSPAHYSAYTKTFLGWETPVEVTAPLLPATIQQAEEANPSSFKLPIRTTSGGEEFFLVENREQVGFDAALPGRGLLIWHVDTGMAENNDEAHRLLDLEEADEGTSGERPQDPGDAWASSAAGFGPFTRPDSNGYGNTPTGWKVRNIGGAGASMTADLTKEVADDLAVIRIGHPAASQPNQAVTITVEVGDRGVRPQEPATPVALTVYRDAFLPGSEVAGVPGPQSTPVMTPGMDVNLTWTFTPLVEGRYIVFAQVTLPGDEILENDERLSAFPVRAFRFFDDVESGGGRWTPNGASNDIFRWSIVDDSMPEGSSHSPTHAWRFGYLGAIPPNPLPPRYHTLTSDPIPLGSGPLYLALYQRYDLAGSEAYSGQTDDGWIEVSFDGGPWTMVGHVSGRDLTWGAFTSDLTSMAAGRASLQVRFNATSDVLSLTGGWWVDDVTLGATPLARAVAILPVIADRSIEPGATATFVLKAVNIGDFSDTYEFSATLPTGWAAVIGGNSSTTVDISALTVRLAPNAEATLQLLVTSPGGVVRGTTASVPLVIRSTTDGSATATFTATARINDPVGLGTLTRYAPYLAGLFLVLGVIVLAIDSHKRRKFRGSLR